MALELLLQRQMSPDEDLGLALDRMAREIKGTLLTLTTLFLLIAFTSYLPLDSLSIFQGRLLNVSNLAGIIGALVSEWFLGTVGITGYSLVLLTGWLSFFAFRGKPLKDSLLKILGVVISTLLLAITIHLIFKDEYPEASLLQGGYVGKSAGEFLQRYFNTTGALLLVGGAFLVTFILTTGLSMTQGVRSLLGGKAKDGEEDWESEEAEEAPARKAAPKAKLAPVAKKAAPKTKPAKKAVVEFLDEADDETDEDEEKTDILELPKKSAKKAAVADDGVDEEEETDEEDAGEDEGPKGFQELIQYSGAVELPTTRLLKSHDSGAKKQSASEIKAGSRKLCEHLLSFQITGEVTAVTQGPVITTYEFKPSAGIKLSKIAALQDDLGIVLGTSELRIVAPIPGKTVVGIEVPRPQAETISFKDIVSCDEFYNKKLKLPIAIGKSTDGVPVFGDLAAMPHLLVAGGTGSGKSVFINTMIMSFLYRMTPQQLRLILVDPKMLELNAFDGIPHLVTNVITKSEKATAALNWAVEEMERRYDLMAQTGSKNIESFNEKMKNAAKKLPFIVIVVDELADLMMSGDRESVEIAITRLAQKARAAGLHLVIATQRPSTDVITGLIKANLPSRLAFRVPSGVDSRTVLDSSGAEGLLGRGDALMIRPAIPMQRLHGCFVSEEELARVVKNVRGTKSHKGIYIDF